MARYRAAASLGGFSFPDNFDPTNTALFGDDAAADAVLTLGTGLAAGATLFDVQTTGGLVAVQQKNPQTGPPRRTCRSPWPSAAWPGGDGDGGGGGGGGPAVGRRGFESLLS